METGKQIREYRKKAGLSQKELGEKLGISQQSIQQYELGKRNPKIAQLKRIANALDIPTEYLFGETRIDFMTEDDMAKIEYGLNKGETDMQSVLFRFGYSLIRRDGKYIIQKIVDGTYGKTIVITQQEYNAFIEDMRFFTKYLMEKLFNSHDFYFIDTDI